MATFKCSICGNEVDLTEWNNADELLKHQMCQTCNHWRTQHELDQTKRGEHGFAIIDGTHYTLHPHTDDYFKGFGGHLFTIKFNDGTVVKCDNVWCQGDIKEPHFRKLMPDNAVLVNHE